MKRPEQAMLGRLLIWTAALATLAVTPWASIDPINVPKLAVIAIGGFIALGVMLANRKSFFDTKYRMVQIFSIAFITDLLIVLFVSGTDTAQEFFGAYGRATGFVAYASLCFLLIAGVLAASPKVLFRFTWALLSLGGLSIAYGVIQVLGADPIMWVNKYSPVIGFLGNPNFQSSFVGFSGVLAVALLLAGSARVIERIGYSTYLVLVLYVIKETNSQQGFLVFAGGSAIVGLIWISKSKFKVLTIPALVSAGIGMILVTLGSLNSGPFAGLLYKESVTYRGDYWRAGWKMTMEHPFFGVGLDSYGDWYRRARNVAATVRRGPDVTSNSAHNVVIDFSANGGIPLAAIYLFMVGLVVIASIRLISRGKEFDSVVAGLIAVWVAYQAQSIISLNQLGLAVWGWIISGLIIGFEIHTKGNSSPEFQKEFVKKGKSAKEIATSKVSGNSLIGMFTGFLVGLLVGVPPQVASSKFKSALESGNAELMLQSAYHEPTNSIFMGEVAAILQQNKLEAQGLKLISEAVVKFPDSFDLWALLADSPTASAEQKAQAAKEMKRLDPHNPNLK